MKQKHKQQDRYQVRFDEEVFIDLFSGGGGTSTGIEKAIGRPVFAAVNHDPDAIAQHAANHPYTMHYQTSVWEVDPETACQGRKVALLWASPDCKHFSKARGGKPVNKNIRSLSWVVLKWALEVRPRVLMMENVEEIQTWGPLIHIQRGREKVWVPDPAHSGETFMAFIGMLTTGVPLDHPALEEACHYLHIAQGDPRRQRLVEGLGYKVEYRELVAADYGAPTTRKRFMLCGRCDGKPIVWPQRTHAPRGSELVRSGKCKPWRSAAEIIDWSLPSYSIFDTKEAIKARYGVNAVRPLADNTMKRVICGVDKHSIRSLNPFIIQQKFSNPAQDITNPLSTVTSVGAHELVSPVMAPFTFSNTGGSVGAPANEPVHTIRSAGGQVLASASLMCIGQTGGGDRLRDVREPVPTVVSKQEACLLSASLIQYHTETSDSARTAGLHSPINTVDAANRYGLATAQLVEYYGNGQAVDVAEPLHTVTSHDRDALAMAHVVEFKGQDIGQDVHRPLRTITASAGEFGVCRAVLAKVDSCRNLGHWPKIRALLNKYCGYSMAEDEIILLIIGGIAYFIADILLRMLTPRELYNAMGFPVDYIIDRDHLGKPYPKSKQVARCGNAVCPPMAEAMVRANFPEYCCVVINTMAQFHETVALGSI